MENSCAPSRVVALSSLKLSGTKAPSEIPRATCENKQIEHKDKDNDNVNVRKRRLPDFSCNGLPPLYSANIVKATTFLNPVGSSFCSYSKRSPAYNGGINKNSLST